MRLCGDKAALYAHTQRNSHIHHWLYLSIARWPLLCIIVACIRRIDWLRHLPGVRGERDRETERFSMPLTRRDVVGHIKGLFYIYCIASCSTVLVFLMSLFGLPFLLLNKHFQRQLQQLAQSAWVYLLLGITAHAADSELIVYLPEECGPEMEKIVYEKLKMGFNFGLAAARLEESESPPTPRDRRRDIIISNHQIYMDWIYIWALMARIRREGNVKIILKRSLLNIPVFGIVGHCGVVRLS